MSSSCLTPPETPKPLLASSISTTFQPSEFADTILVSSDGVVFFVLAGQLTSHSENAFAGLLSATTSPGPAASPEVHHVEQTAAVLNVVLHALHGLELTLYKPDLATLCAAVDVLLVQYAVPATLVICPATPLFDALLAHAQLKPLDVFAFAAKRNLEDLAIASSANLLSFPLHTLSDDDAERIGPKYLRRLFCLHMARVKALHQLLLTMPVPHATSPYCTVADAEAMKSAWMLAAARLNLQARPDHTSHSLQATLSPVLVKVWCKDCRKALQTRIDALISDWAAVKVCPTNLLFSTLYDFHVRVDVAPHEAGDRCLKFAYTRLASFGSIKHHFSFSGPP